MYLERSKRHNKGKTCLNQDLVGTSRGSISDFVMAHA
jgi:hypothetical protein